MDKWYNERAGKGVINVYVPTQLSKDWEYWILLSADRHHDNPKTLNELEYRHLEELREKGGLCIDVGDFFCAMQGKYDKRANKSAIKEEHLDGDYLDRLVDTAIEDFKPHADLFAVIGKGNHETAIKKNHETDLTTRLVDGLRRETGSQVLAGGYRGWVDFKFVAGEGDTEKVRFRKTLWYHHGYGGGGPVTKGVIQTNRRASYVDADMLITGHIHERWVVETLKTKLTKDGNEIVRPQLHLQTATYKEEYMGQDEGFHIEKGRPPKPIGAMWLRFFYNRHHEDIEMEVTPAR